MMAQTVMRVTCGFTSTVTAAGPSWAVTSMVKLQLTISDIQFPWTLLGTGWPLGHMVMMAQAVMRVMYGFTSTVTEAGVSWAATSMVKLRMTGPAGQFLWTLLVTG